MIVLVQQQDYVVAVVVDVVDVDDAEVVVE